MKPRLPPAPRKEGSTFNDLKTFARDVPYALTMFGCVLFLLAFPFRFLLESAESPSYQDLFGHYGHILSYFLLAVDSYQERHRPQYCFLHGSSILILNGRAALILGRI